MVRNPAKNLKNEPQLSYVAEAMNLKTVLQAFCSQGRVHGNYVKSPSNVQRKRGQTDKNCEVNSEISNFYEVDSIVMATAFLSAPDREI